MGMLFDLLPVLVFFFVYHFHGIYAATQVIMILIAVQVAISYYRNKRLEMVHGLSLILVLMFGGATLLFRNPHFIQMKPTIFYGIMALTFFASHLIGGKKPLIQRMLEKKITLPNHVWLRLSWGWIGFSFLSAAINYYVAQNFDESTWVNFKLFGLTGLTIIFVILQSIYLSHHISEENIPLPPEESSPKP